MTKLTKGLQYENNIFTQVMVGLGLVSLLPGIVFSQWHRFQPGQFDGVSMISLSCVVVFVGLLLRRVGWIQGEEDLAKDALRIR